MRKSTKLLQDAIKVFTDRPRIFVGIMIVPVLLSVIIGIFAPDEGTEPLVNVGNIYQIIAVFVGIIAMIVANILMGIALMLAINDQSMGAMQAYRQSWPYFWKYILLSILMVLAIIIGFILFIVPGVIVSVWLAFATWVLVLENKGIIESMKTSREYVRGKWGGVFIRLAVLGLVAFLVMFVLGFAFGILESMVFGGRTIVGDIFGGILTIVISPIAAAYVYLMYQDVKSPVVGA